ncbi:MAG TPA: nucleotidyl transferase AbiEii/AbiGii toxin family protein [Chitinivibrionales bacterium]|nr:nucleotidyl transferase AbiEii/AbiGii toxin family protein [Chitinivibrionales bacterium]
MELKPVFEAIARFFEKEKIDYGIIGAYALFSYGYVRATRDMDFITRKENTGKITRFLESLGFNTAFSSEAFSNFLHPVNAVRVDVMYVEGDTADVIFKATERRLVFKDLELPVVSPEHLIAMKLFSAQSNPDRKFKDLSDVKEILRHTQCNKDVVRDYFIKYGQQAYYREITGESIDGKNP